MDDQLNFDPQYADLLYPRSGIGITLKFATLNLYRQYNPRETVVAVVADVDRDGRADRAGLKSKDLVLQLNGVNVSGLPGASKDLLEAVLSKIKSSESGTLEILIRREDKEILVTL